MYLLSNFLDAKGLTDSSKDFCHYKIEPSNLAIKLLKELLLKKTILR